jgi:hypothetical protein
MTMYDHVLSSSEEIVGKVEKCRKRGKVGKVEKVARTPGFSKSRTEQCFISNHQRLEEGTFCASELAGIEPTPARSGRAEYEINIWMWRYGRTFPRQISVEQAVELRKKRVQDSAGIQGTWR